MCICMDVCTFFINSISNLSFLCIVYMFLSWELCIYCLNVVILLHSCFKYYVFLSFKNYVIAATWLTVDLCSIWHTHTSESAYSNSVAIIFLFIMVLIFHPYCLDRLSSSYWFSLSLLQFFRSVNFFCHLDRLKNESRWSKRGEE